MIRMHRFESVVSTETPRSFSSDPEGAPEWQLPDSDKSYESSNRECVLALHHLDQIDGLRKQKDFFCLTESECQCILVGGDSQLKKKRKYSKRQGKIQPPEVTFPVLCFLQWGTISQKFIFKFLLLIFKTHLVINDLWGQSPRGLMFHGCTHLHTSMSVFH